MNHETIYFMPFIYDRVKETTTTAGTGAITLAGAPVNFRAFSSVLSSGDTCYYVIEDTTNNQWECGIGTGNGGSGLTRTTITASSSTGSAVNFGAGTKYVWIDLTTSSISKAPTDYILLVDQKTSGTNGGTFTAGAWQTRDLNAEYTDTGNLCTLSSNQFTLLKGTYRIRASCPAYACNSHQARLYNVTDGAFQLLGTSEFIGAAVSAQSRSMINGRFTVNGAASKTYRIEHYCGTTSNTFGFGVAGSIDVEIYTIVELERELS